MSADGGVRVPLQVSQDCVVASIQVDLTEEVLNQFRIDLLELLHSSGACGVILDLTGVDIMDLEDFEALRKTLSMAALMGAHTILAGMKPGVVAALVELEAPVEDVRAALNLDLAFEQMREELIRTEGSQTLEAGSEQLDETDSCDE